MQDHVLLSGLDEASQLELWVLWLKVMATGIASTLLILLAVFTCSLRTHGRRVRRVAYHFTLASLFATLYIGADTAVRIAVAVGNIQDVLVPIRLALSAIVLSIAAYINLYWVLETGRSTRRRSTLVLYVVAGACALLVWVDHPSLIIASDTLRLDATAVYPDYGSAAGPFFTLCLLSFAGVCVCLMRTARRAGGDVVWWLTVMGLALLLATGGHDVLRELGMVSSRIGMLPLGYAAFQVGAFAVLALHYSRTLREHRDNALQLRRLSHAVARDAHTGLFARAHLEQALDRLDPEATGGLLFIDLDSFKQVNDRFGHACGDELLRAVAECIHATLREDDLACRWGGDEFVVYLRGSEPGMVPALTERLRTALDAITLEHAPGVHVTVSIGFAELGDGQWRDTLRRADRAMYDAKQAGRNRIVVAAPSAARST